MTEFSQKRERILALLEERNLNALLLQRVSSFAWATCGASSYVNRGASIGEASLLITPANQTLITNNIEAPRLAQEEGLAEQGWEFHISPWYEIQEITSRLVDDYRLGADGSFPGAVDLSMEVAHLRSRLTPQEGERFRTLGRLCAEAMRSTVEAVRPGQSEHQIAALLANETESRGVQAIVNLIATDDRIFSFRHPLPTEKKLDRYAMLVLCGRQWGLFCSLTRLVHIGSLPQELRQKAEAVARVDATFIAATRPGRTLGEIFNRAINAYSEIGFADEWRLHHQGGPAGYEPREYIATPDSPFTVTKGQAYAWNPSITGTKSEDTILVGNTGNEILTSIDGWPKLSVTLDDGTYERPAIMELP
jgi:Xaa-Pro aminopeptidase